MKPAKNFKWSYLKHKFNEENNSLGLKYVVVFGINNEEVELAKFSDKKITVLLFSPGKKRALTEHTS